MGKQIGRRLMQLCLQELSGSERIYLWALAENEKALRFYERFGFHRDGAEKLLTLGTPVKGVRLVLERGGASHGA